MEFSENGVNEHSESIKGNWAKFTLDFFLTVNREKKLFFFLDFTGLHVNLYDIKMDLIKLCFLKCCISCINI